MPIFNTIITACWLVFIVFWVISAFSAKKNTRRGRGIVFRLVFAIVVVFILKTPSATEFIRLHPLVISSLPLNILGVIVCMSGVALAIWARVNIGRNWGMPMSVKTEPELVTSGPYQYVRHPIYSGVIFAALGSALAVSGWWLIGLITFGSYFIYSATKEEQYLTKEFPNQYPEYKKRTKMLIPFVF